VPAPRATTSDDYRVELIRLAREIALAETGGGAVPWNARPEFLRQFRAAYLHLAASVAHGGGVLSLLPARASLAESDKLLETFDKEGKK
jgi:hypothetical protein